MAYAVTGVAGIGFFALSVVLLGVWPGRTIDAQVAASSPKNVLRLDSAEERGRHIYAREGCAYCHTQQVRYLEEDIRRYGAPTLAWETRFDSPHLWGTRRIGPDLSREGGARSDDWHHAHLFAPRDVVAPSIMPSYAALFDGSALRPRQEARDLVAYLQSLGRARALAWPEGEQCAKDAMGSGDYMSLMAFIAPELNAHPAMARPGSKAPSLAGVAAAGNGRQLWREHCAGCHGPEGKGDGPAAAWLKPRPANLAAHRYSRDYLVDVMWNGLAGTSMPALRDQPSERLAALLDVVAGFSMDDDQPVEPAAQVAGAEVYAAHCIQCHGASGKGDGFAADAFKVAAVDFTTRRPTLEQGMEVLRNGIPGTPMARWSDRLDAAQMRAVIQHVRGFFAAGKTGPEPPP